MSLPFVHQSHSQWLSAPQLTGVLRCLYVPHHCIIIYCGQSLFCSSYHFYFHVNLSLLHIHKCPTTFCHSSPKEYDSNQCVRQAVWQWEALNMQRFSYKVTVTVYLMNMELQQFVQTCVCNHSFDAPGAFTRHRKNCKKHKRQLGDVLLRAKEFYISKKQHLQTSGEIVPSHDSHSVIAVSHHEGQSIMSSGKEYRNCSGTQSSQRLQVRFMCTMAFLSTLMQHR